VTDRAAVASANNGAADSANAGTNANANASPIASPIAGLDLGTPISGPAYSRGYRIGAAIVLLLVAAQGLRAWDEIAPAIHTQGGWMLIGGAFVLLASFVLLLTSVTTVDAAGLRQSGLIERKIGWSEIRHARVRGFGFARRLVLSTGYGKFRAFYGGTPQLLAAFEKIAAAHAPPR
jgi:hypothetical protein